MTELPDKIEIRDIKPALSGYLSKALILLKRSPVPDDDAIHDIRVLMKKSRAVMKLTRPLVTSDWHDRDFESLKQVGSILSSWRDTSVHRKTLKDLKRKYPALFLQLSDNEKINRLIARPVPAVGPDEQMTIRIKEIEDLLVRTGYRIRFNQMKDINSEGLLIQLKESFEKVRIIYLKCRNNTRPEKIHQFRKLSKDFLYQLWFFRTSANTKIKSASRRMDRLAQNLGKYNDLYQLLLAIEYTYPNEHPNPAMDELVVKIRGLQDGYLIKVWQDAYKCFSPGLTFNQLTGL
jgi:CHAD domain-containing protein